MKRLKLFAAVLLLSAAPAYATSVTTTGAGGAAGAAPSYTGAGDIVASNVWGYWGLRAWSNATMGTKLVNVCLPSDTFCGDVNSDASTGIIPNTITLNGSTCNNSTVVCTIKTWYELSGGGGPNVTQATIGSRATLSISCGGLSPGKPCATGASSVNYTFTGPTYASVNYTFICAAERTGTFTTENDCMGQNQAGAFITMGFSTSANTGFFYSGGGGSATGTANDSTWHAIIGVGDATTPVLYTDGTSHNGPNASASQMIAYSLGLMNAGSAANQMTGNAFEFGIWLSQFNGTQAANMNSNMHTQGGY